MFNSESKSFSTCAVWIGSNSCVSKPLISEANWRKSHFLWSIKKVMWSESRFTLFQCDECIRVRREADEVLCEAEWNFGVCDLLFFCIYDFHALLVCLHSCVMGIRKRGGIIQQQWHAQSPGPYQYLPPDTAGKIRRLVSQNTNHSQKRLRKLCMK